MSKYIALAQGLSELLEPHNLDIKSLICGDIKFTPVPPNHDDKKPAEPTATIFSLRKQLMDILLPTKGVLYITDQLLTQKK